MSQNLMIASNQWATRPADERFLTLEDVHVATKARSLRSDVELVSHGRILPRWSDEAGDLVVSTPGAQDALLSHWSAGQLASKAKVRADLVRRLGALQQDQPGLTVPTGVQPKALQLGGEDLPTELVSDLAQVFGRINPGQLAASLLHTGLVHMTEADDGLLLNQLDDEGNRVQAVRAITGTGYGRVWDHEVVEAVMAMNDAAGGAWKVPSASYATTNPKQATTLYASDHDVFLFLVDDQRSIEVPRPGGGNETFFRGFIVGNSEVGAASLFIMTFLYQFVCDNRIIWGAEEVQELRIRHSVNAPSWFASEGRRHLEKYAGASAEQTQRRLRRAMEIDTAKLGKAGDDAKGRVVSWLRSKSFTASEATKIQRRAAETGDGSSLWSLVDAGTQLARSIDRTDDRVSAERRVSRLLQYAA